MGEREGVSDDGRASTRARCSRRSRTHADRLAYVRAQLSDDYEPLFTEAADDAVAVHGSISTPGLSSPARVERVLGRAQRRGERVRAAARRTRAVVAADGVVVRDRAARFEDRVGPRRLDLRPLATSSPRRAGASTVK